METAGVICPSKSPYASPVVVVTKKDGSLQLCINYRKLNSCSTKDWERPTNCMEVLQFLGFVDYYRRYVKRYSNLAAPLFRLTSGDTRKKKRGPQKSPGPNHPLLWTAECEEAFQSLKEKLISAPVLGYSDYSQPFLLQTDASGMG